MKTRIVILVIVLMLATVPVASAQNQIYLPQMSTAWGWAGIAFLRCGGENWFRSWDLLAVYPDNGGQFRTQAEYYSGSFFVPSFGHEFAYFYIEGILTGVLDKNHLIQVGFPYNCNFEPGTGAPMPLEIGPQPLPAELELIIPRRIGPQPLATQQDSIGVQPGVMGPQPLPRDR